MQIFKVILIFISCSFAASCEQTNSQNYYGSRVIDATAYDQNVVSNNTTDNRVYSKDSKASLNKIEPKVYNNDTKTTAQQESLVSTSQVGVVKPYVPDTEDVKAANTNTQKQAYKNIKSNINVPVDKNADTYTVSQGDTLYSIAFRYGLDYKNLAKRNNIEPPYNISVGQVLKLNIQSSQAPVYIVKKSDTLYSIAKANGQSVSFLAGVNNLHEPYNLKVGQKLYLARTNTPQKNTTSSAVPVAGDKVVAQDKNTTLANNNKTQESANATTPISTGKTRKVSGVTWMWPTKGNIIEKFSLSERGNKGIDIGGQRGQSVYSASDGQVVYAGNALRGFGNLIIINHANEFLSAYAHNEKLLVKEGQKVRRGQQIATMGSTDAKSVRLHFEIRYRGQSVNPLNYLPK